MISPLMVPNTRQKSPSAFLPKTHYPQPTIYIRNMMRKPIWALSAFVILIWHQTTDVHEQIRREIWTDYAPFALWFEAVEATHQLPKGRWDWLGGNAIFFLCRCVDIIWGWKVGRKTDRNPKFRWTFWVYAELFHLPMNLIHYPKWAHKVINNWHLHHALGFALPPLPAFLELVFPSSGFASSTALCLHGDLVQLMHVSFGILEF